jgi:octaprenyl-diphosphate synthase
MSAFETTVKERSLEIIDILTRLTRKMTEGELIQLTTIGSLSITEDEYMDVLRRKTAYLFSACCEVGAILAGANESDQRAMSDFGMDLGIAFQITDDILDLTSSSDQLGKAAGTDLLEGKVTLPLILLMAREPVIKSDLEKIMLDGDYGRSSREKLTEKLDSQGILDEARQYAHTYAAQARKSIDVLPQTEYRSCLTDILSFVIDRNI